MATHWYLLEGLEKHEEKQLKMYCKCRNCDGKTFYCDAEIISNSITSRSLQMTRYFVHSNWSSLQVSSLLARIHVYTHILNNLGSFYVLGAMNGSDDSFAQLCTA